MKLGERDPSLLDDQEFERLLFASARQDPKAADVEAFWARLSTTIEGVAALGAAGAGAAAGGLGWGGRAYRAVAFKWLIVGALTGSAVTALTFVSLGALHRLNPVQAARAASTPAPVVATSTPAAQANPPLAATEPELAGTVALAPKPQRCTGCARVALPRAEASGALPHAAPDSELGAQVALLDAARTAAATGRPGEALRLADQYRSDFSSGQLAPEAELVAIEALAVRGDQAALAERSARFLDRYPNDPHAARVKALSR